MLQQQSVVPHITNGVNFGYNDTTNINPPISEINTEQLTTIINNCINPLKTEIQSLRDTFTIKMKTIEDKMTLIQSENNQLKEETAILTDIIVNMQSSLNKIDGDGRANNLIISKIPEGKMTVHNEIDSEDDKVKINHLLSKLELEDESIIENIEINRLGQPKPGVSRLIKVKLQSSADRNKILENTKILKNLQEPWSNIYINKDLHPVYSKQNKRLRDKMAKIKMEPQNRGKNIRIVKGKLMVDDNVVDKNPFFG